MKIKMGFFEIDVKARTEFNQKMNAEDTKHFLYFLANALSEASQWNKIQGYEYIAKSLEEMIADINNTINSQPKP